MRVRLQIMVVDSIEGRAICHVTPPFYDLLYISDENGKISNLCDENVILEGSLCYDFNIYGEKKQ
jgi:hypothetical protein